MRFTLLSLMLFTTAAAVLCGAFFALPEGFDVIVLCALTVSILPAASIAGIVYGRGYIRAFSIGYISSMCWIIGIVPMGFLINGVASGGEIDRTSIKFIIAVLMLTMGLSGLVAVGIRWLCLRAAQRSSIATMAHSAPRTILIDPRDKAELYAILEGRFSSRPVVPATDGASPFS